MTYEQKKAQQFWHPVTRPINAVNVVKRQSVKMFYRTKMRSSKGGNGK